MTFIKGHKIRVGIKHTEETKKKIGKASKNRKVSKETRIKQSESLKGKTPWNKGLTGYKKIGMTGKNNPNWKGDKVGYHALHTWINKHKGKPTKCEHCGKDGLKGREIHWANKSGKYLRNLNDWLRLCVKCHRKYDKAQRNL